VTSPSRWNLYGLPLLLVVAAILTVLSVLGRPGASTTDFLVFHQSGRQFLAGANPYVPFVIYRGPNLNPPWVVAIMAQLSRAPVEWAVVIWWAIGFACLAASLNMIHKELPHQRLPAIAAAVLVTQAAYANIRLGQVAFPLMLLMTAAWRADRADRPLLCGVLVGLAAAWKPFLLVFAPYLIWRRAWPALAAMAVTIALTIAVGFLAVGAAGYASWLGVLQLVGWEGHPLNASLRGMVTRALTLSTLLEQHTTPIVDAPAWRDGAWLALSLTVAAITVVRITVKQNIHMAWAALGLMALVISPLGWVHYVPIVTGPIAAVLLAGRPFAQRLGIAGWVLLCIPFAWLKTAAFGPVLTLTVASAYGWGTLLLLAAVLLA
jgi:Glycosyltransferase family 87